MTRKTPFLLVALILCSGCSSASFYYKSAEPSPLTPKSVPGYTYDIATMKGHGELRVTPLGTRSLPGVSDHPVFVVRYYVDNKSGVDWKIELANQLIAYGTNDVPRAPIASGLSASQSALIATTGREQVFDMVFATPTSEPESLGFDWKLGFDGKTQSGHLDFYRAPIPSAGMQGYNETPINVNSKRGRGASH